MDTGDKIKALRIERGMTLEELGDLVGVGKSTVRKWETGAIKNMGRDKIEKLCSVFDVPPDYLIKEESKKVELSNYDKRFLEWFHSLPEEKRRAILIAQDAPKDLL